jgi:IclR family transcriptional regulator, acetate operon repressor
MQRPDVSAQPEERLVGADRVLHVLKELARHPLGASLDEITLEIGSPKPTVHRALTTLVRAGLASRDAAGHYVLGDEFLRMAFAHHAGRPDTVRITPALEQLAELFNETVHYAVLDDHEVVYRAKIDPPTGAVRLTSTIGGRNPAYATAVGKVLLSFRLETLEDVESWFAGAQPSPRTTRTKLTPAALHRDLQASRRSGFAMEEEENEPGIACLAFPVWFTGAGLPDGAVSISAVAYRTPLSRLLERREDVAAILGPFRTPPS